MTTDKRGNEVDHLGLSKPLILLAAPLILLLPYYWLLLRYLPAREARPPDLTVEHMRFHYFFLWLFTYFPLSSICFISSAVMFARRARTSTGARWTLAVSAFFAVITVGLLVMVFIFG